MRQPIISVRDLHKSYPVAGGRLQVLRGIDLAVSEGEIVAIMGRSGCGKSTLLNVLGLLDGYDTGEYLLAGTSMSHLSQVLAAHYRNRVLGFVFQSFHLIPFKTAVENVALPLCYRATPRRERPVVARKSLEMMGLGEWAEMTPNELSGGQKQRVAIARALVTDPRVILADEPTGALDPTTANEILDILCDLRSHGLTVLVVTHEMYVARRADRVLQMSDGIIESEIHC